MKFAEHLAAHITPEWRKQYIMYEVSGRNMEFSQAKQPGIVWPIVTYRAREFSCELELHASALYEVRLLSGAHVRHLRPINFPTPTQFVLFTCDKRDF